MRWMPLAAACLAGSALAAPAPKPAPTWADWVGDYSGTRGWTGCSAPGAKTAAISVDAIDGALTVDLAKAGGGLRALPLVEEDTAWTAQQGDISARLGRPSPNTLALTVELESGCRVTAQLKRATTKLDACDRLVAWTRVEARCTKLHDAPLEDPAAIARTSWKAGDADRCQLRAANVELELVDAGCAPHPDPLIGVRAADCLALAATADKLHRCGNVPPQLKAYLVNSAHGLAAAAQTADKGTLPVVEAQCRDAKTLLIGAATKFSCLL